MKTVNRIITATLLAIVAISTSSCYIRISNDAKEQLKRRIKFKEEMSEVIYDESDSLVIRPGEFYGIESRTGMDIAVVQREGEPEVVIKGKHRSRDMVKVENVDGILKVTYKENQGIGLIFFNDDEVAIFYTPSLKSLDNQGSGDITIEGPFISDSLSIDKRGSGDITGSVQAEVLKVNSSGSGDIDLDVNSTGKLTVSALGSGDVDLKGKADDAVIVKSGSGDLDARKFDATNISVSSSGSGDTFYKKDGKLIEEID